MTLESWNIQKLIHWTTGHFASKKIDTARLDSEILLAHVLKCKRLDLYLNFDKPLKPEELKDFKELVKRRSVSEPVAYLTGTQEFYGKSFHVGSGVLIPRPETEHLVTEILDWLKTRPEVPMKLLDVGAGSGCIGLAVALNNSFVSVTAVENSDLACEFISLNQKTLQLDDSRFELHRMPFLNFAANVIKSDDESFDQSFDVIVSNPPYIPTSESQNLSVDVAKFEPREALFGGTLGTEHFSEWVPRMTKMLKKEGLLILEIGFNQGLEVIEILKIEKTFKDIRVKKDYSGHDRMVMATKES